MMLPVPAVALSICLIPVATSSGGGNFIETLMRADGTPLQIDGLWALLPLGYGVWFIAGIADEEHGLFGIITED
jgi:hypothetical protein